MDLFDRAAWQKNSEIRRIVKRGHATLKEIIAINYGEWPLRGLDIIADEHLEKLVSIEPMRRYLWTLLTSPAPSFLDRLKRTAQGVAQAHTSVGLAIHGDNREIYLNKIKIKWAFLRHGAMITNRVIAHERRHIHQFDNVVPGRRVDLYGQTYGPPNILFANAVLTKLISDSLKDMGTLRRSWAKAANRIAPIFKALNGIGLSKYYFREGIEIQSRLEELLVQGYPHWPHMPQNREQLYAAMMDAGLKPPGTLLSELEQRSSFAQERSAFQSKAFQRTKAPYGLVRAIDQLPTAKAKDDFWRFCLPILYSDILESLGDREGRARMGFGINTTLLPLLLGKDHDACQHGEFSEGLQSRITQKLKLLNSDYAAGSITRYFLIAEEKRLAIGAADIPEGDRRFICAFTSVPDIKKSLETHNSALIPWLNRDNCTRPRTGIFDPPALRS